MAWCHIDCNILHLTYCVDMAATATSPRRYCDRACLLVSWFVCSFVAFIIITRISKNKIPIFMRFETDVQRSAPNVIVNISEVRFKVQGRSRRNENLPLVGLIARP